MLYMLIFFTFIYWLVCWVAHLVFGFEVIFFKFHFCTFYCHFCFLCTCFLCSDPGIHSFHNLWSKSKFYWVISILSVNYIFSNTFCFWFTFPWHFEIQFWFLCTCVIYKLLRFFWLKNQSNYNPRSIVSNEIVASRYVNFIVVSINLLWANACLLMCISSPLNLKGN